MRINNLLPASFKGVSFSVKTEDQPEGGRKIILHEYPNSSQRGIEDLGRIPPRFAISAFVHGENYQQRARQLQRALESGGAGRLVMPTLGTFTVTALPYRIRASQQSVGIIEFQLEFAIGNALVAPTRAPATEQTVFQLGDNTRTVIQESLSSMWKDPTNSTEKRVAQFDVQSSIDDFTNAMRTTASPEELQAVIKKGEFIKRNVGALVRNGRSLANNINSGTSDDIGFMQLLSEAAPSGSSFSQALSLCNWGSGLELQLSEINRSFRSQTDSASRDVPLWPPTTAQRKLRNSNRLAIVDTARANALAVSMEQLASTEFQTDTEITDSREQFEEQYSAIVNVEGADRDRVVGDPEVRRALADMRLATLEVLQNKQQSAFRVEQLENIGMTSVPLITYQLYAEEFILTSQFEERANITRGLNPSRSAIDLGGDATVLRS